MIIKDIQRLSIPNKMTTNSYKININRLEKNLTDVLKEIDHEGQNTINFEQLGRILTIM